MHTVCSRRAAFDSHPMADHIVDNNVVANANAIVILYLLQTTHDAPRCDSDPVPVVDNQAAERA